MASFTDRKQLAWSIDLDVAAVRRVKSTLGVDLLAVAEAESTLLARLYTDPIFLVDLLYVLVQEQAQARGISDEDFGAGLGGESIDQAAEALLQAITDFFPRRQREVLQALLAKVDEGMERVVVRIRERVATPQLTAAIDREIDRLLPPLPASGT
jgi:hypothetical protein